jgi:hypothetical protein
VNPITWQNLNNDLAALRRFTEEKAGDKMDNGAREITFYGPSGQIEVESNIYVKQGDAFLLADPERSEYWKRIGSTDITFDLPGFAGPSLYLPSPTNTGVEVRVFTSQALFHAKPSHCVYLQSITPSTN